MKELVDHILYIANSNNKKITNLQIHKITYFALGYLIRENHNDLASKLYQKEVFQAWTYGPVLPETYERFKIYKNMPILDNGQKSEVISSLNSVDTIILNLIHHDVFDLVNVSHKHKFWNNNKDKVMNNEKPIYSYEVLMGEFSK